MMMNCTLKDVATEAQVSICTVSRILNEVPGFKYGRATRQRVRSLAQRMGYMPSRVGRAMRLGRTFSIACVWIKKKPFATYFDSETYSVLCQHLMAAGYDVSLYTPEDWRHVADDLARRHDGVIVAEVEEAETRAAIRALNLPVVEMNTQSGATTDAVQPADADAGEMLGRHLAGLGYRRLVFLQVTSWRAYGRLRLEGIRKVAQQHGMDIEAVSSHEMRPLLRSLQETPREELRQTVFVQQSGVNTLEAIYYMALGMGFEVPRDFGLCSCDISSPERRFEEKRVTGMTYSVDDMAAMTADMLCRKIEKPGLVLPPCRILHRLYEGETVEQCND